MKKILQTLTYSGPTSDTFKKRAAFVEKVFHYWTLAAIPIGIACIIFFWTHAEAALRFIIDNFKK